MHMEDETAISEITIMPDGRVYVFGTSREVLEVLSCLEGADSDLARRLEHLRAMTAERPQP